ncbi:glycosyltransferase family protein [Alkalibacter mobilis]|uniref:glycosyltransferase n=1 Tax=Alkalibacter mobilis TaxID=2787712 RepID=UPI0018A05638|nr:glycosyltransferase [Alkalibacter mobilis]MBF7097818.1 glycosyltransferase [Alkalibacter mobilis]
MRILLLGEFSGFYKNLKEGLQELGHEVDAVSSGDGWKSIGNSDFKLFSEHDNKYLRYVENFYMQAKNINKLSDYDVVQIVQPIIFGLPFNRNIRLLENLKKNNNKVFLSVAGDHYYIYKIAQNLRYNYFTGLDMKDNKYTNSKYIHNNEEVLKLVDGIIPVMFTYAEAYRTHEKLLRTIPLPLNVDKIQYIPQEIKNGKLTIFHGLNREESKGTKFIREAMERIKQNYPNDVEIIIDGKMPLEQYLKVLSETNVVIDQALSYEYGMNAIYSMAMGKVVLSGNEPECQQEFARYDIPVINIEPSVEDIYSKLEKLILNKKSVISIGEKSRLFVEEFHHHVKIAQQYIDAWEVDEVKE